MGGVSFPNTIFKAKMDKTTYTFDELSAIRLTQNFRMSEFMQSGGVIQEPITAEIYDNIKKLAFQMQLLRNEINLRFGEGHSIVITSGFRTPERNKLVSRAKQSRHLVGQACDFVVKNNGKIINMIDVFDLMETLMDEGRLTRGGLGYYPPAKNRTTFIHYDIGRNGRKHVFQRPK